jgi:xylan 1,4-beta-xylosidase
MKKTSILFLTAFILQIVNIDTSAQKISFEINTQNPVGENTYFWKAAGHDLFDLANTSSGDALMKRLQQYKSITYLRSHNTFDDDPEKGGHVIHYNDDGSYTYDFSIVNRTYREYLKYGLKPIVEFDFFPNGFVKSLKNAGNSDESAQQKNDEGFDTRRGEPKNWKEWERLLRAFMQNLIDNFGKKEMLTWYFEVWNEPDAWPNEHLDVFFKLYDVFASVVKSYDENFKVGGPGCFNLYFMKDFLEHVVNGINYVTGKKGSPINFVSHHIYGLSGEWLKSPPEIVPQVSRFTQELLWVGRLLRRYHLNEKVEFHLNEWGVCSNLNRTVDKYPQLVYRNNEFSPLFMIKMVDCLYALQDNWDFKTSMMLYWGFCLEANRNVMFAGNRDLTTGGNIPKPIMIGFEMLAMLGKERLEVKNALPGNRYGIIATRENNKIIFIVYNFNETDDDLERIEDVQVILKNFPSKKKLNWKEITLDNQHNNSYSSWIQNNRPDNPVSLPPSFIREASSIKINSEGKVLTDTNGIVTLQIPLKRHSMKLFELE